MRVIVCGGRDYINRRELFQELDKFHAEHVITELAHGAQRGADTLAGEWAESRGVPCKPFPADWDHLGNAAGPDRNERMLIEFAPDAVIAFDGGPGTRDMSKRARRKRPTVPVVWLPDDI